MNWIYENKTFEPDEQTLQEYVGFVYIITEKDTDMKYIGKKLFHFTKTLPITKTRKRRKRVLVESDWRDYYGSSEKVRELLVERGAEAFDREILRLCKSKGECSYFEAKYQFDYDVLLREDFYNGIINCRINRKHLKL
jgi:hypothetical protein